MNIDGLSIGTGKFRFLGTGECVLQISLVDDIWIVNVKYPCEI